MQNYPWTLPPAKMEYTKLLIYTDFQSKNDNVEKWCGGLWQEMFTFKRFDPIFWNLAKLLLDWFSGQVEFFLWYVISVLTLKTNYQEEVGIPSTDLTNPHFLFYIQVRTWISIACYELFLCERFEMRYCTFSFCWYSYISGPSLFKFLVHLRLVCGFSV